MKASTKTLCTAIALAFATPVLTQAAALVYSTGVSLSSFHITGWTQPNLSGFGAGLSWTIDPGNVLRPTNYTVGIGAAWFAVEPGEVLTRDYVATATPFANSLTGDLSGRIYMTIGETFLIGFWLDANMSSTPNLGDRFGWARIQDTAAGLNLIDSAIENSGQGIYAGTTTIVPEPSTSALLLMPLFGCLCFRKHNFQISE